MSDRGIATRAVRAEDASGLEAFFAGAGVTCYCQYWHFEGSSNDWLDRCANHPADNRQALRRQLQEQEGAPRGLVALAESGIVGWLKLAPAAAIPKLYGQRLYRGLPCFEGDRRSVWTIGCLVVAESWRRRGVARQMVECAIAVAREHGASAIEAFPRRADGVSDAELWMGPFAVYRALGFVIVHDFAPYPVLRLDLR